MTRANEYTLAFEQLRMKDVSRVGGKNASLGELFNNLKPKGIGVLDGFATTADAYWRLLSENHLREALTATLSGFDPEELEQLTQRGHQARSAVLQTSLPADLAADIRASYRSLV